MDRIHNTEMVRGCLSAELQQQISPTLVEYPRGSQSTYVKVGPQKSFTSFLEGSGWRLQHVAILQSRLLPVQDMDALFHPMQHNSCQKLKLRPWWRGDNLGRSVGDWQGCSDSFLAPSLKAEGGNRWSRRTGSENVRELRIKLCPHCGQNASVSSQIGS